MTRPSIAATILSIFMGSGAPYGLAGHEQPAPIKTPELNQPASTMPAKKSLYDRLGGADGIATVVDDFVPRLLVNKTIMANAKVAEKLGKVSVPGIKFKQTAQVSQVTGGPWTYGGKGMKDSHEGLNISEAEWDASVADLKATLDKFKVPKAEQDELTGLIATTSRDIVTAK